jgi:hypothetical protein
MDGFFDGYNRAYYDREANQVAHELARQALVSKVVYAWADSQTTFITALLANDVMLLSDE